MTKHTDKDIIGNLTVKLLIAELALQEIKNNLGVPQPGYPAPVEYAYEIANNALVAIKKGAQND